MKWSSVLEDFKPSLSGGEGFLGNEGFQPLQIVGEGFQSLQIGGEGFQPLHAKSKPSSKKLAANFRRRIQRRHNRRFPTVEFRNLDT